MKGQQLARDGFSIQYLQSSMEFNKLESLASCYSVTSWVNSVPPRHSIRFWVFLSKIVIYDLWLFQLFLVFSKSLYHELSGYVSNISIVCHTLLQEVQEHSLFCSFSWKFRFLLLAKVGKQVQNFAGGPRGIQIQLFLHKIGSTNMLIIHFQKKLGAIKV